MEATIEPTEIPHSLEAEATVLATVLYHPQVFSEIRPFLRPQSFYSADYGVIFESMCALADAGKPVTGEMVREHLRNRGLYQEIGGAKTLNDLIAQLPTPHFVEHQARVVAEKAKLRELITIAGELQKKCLARTRHIEPSEEIAKWLDASISEICERGTVDTIRPLSDLVVETLDAKERREAERIPTGLKDLDNLVGGLPITGHTLVAGKAAMGKSQLCKQFVRNIAATGVPCGIVAIEESGRKIAENYLAGASGIANSKIVYNTVTAEEMGCVIEAAPQVANLPIFVDDAQNRLSSIERSVRRMVRKYKCRVIVVDHLHLIDGEFDGPREQDISNISRRLKNLWKELRVVGVVAAQLNRGGEREAPPELHDLRGSGSLEQDGDLIIQLHRQDYYEWKKQGDTFRPDHRIRMFVNKNKSGSVGYRDAYFDGDSQTISDWNDGRGPFPPQVHHVRPVTMIQDLEGI